MALHTISLCTGLGGIERGLELAAPGAFKPILYCEREISSAAIIANEIERGGLPAAPVWSDLKTLTGGSVARYLDQVGVDCITGGYPCQPFSVAGKRLGEDDERHLFPFIAQAIERYAPTLCFFENVSGHLVLGFREVCECLERLGYRVAAGLFTAAEVGAGHRRERLFILAYCGSKRRQQDAGSTSGNEETDAGGSSKNDHQFASVDASVADPSCERPQGQQCQQGPDERSTRRSSGADVVDATGIRRQRHREGRWQGEIEAGRLQNISGRYIPPFPPRPASRDWRHIVERWPELAPAVESEATKPAFRGVADGVSRADQLRAYGNAVVPHCAAVAFISLWAALTGGGDDE